jgi:hypothetical protein
MKIIVEDRHSVTKCAALERYWKVTSFRYVTPELLCDSFSNATAADSSGGACVTSPYVIVVSFRAPRLSGRSATLTQTYCTISH